MQSAQQAAEQLKELFEADAVGPLAGFPKAPSHRMNGAQDV